jgi:hypothetical protein
MKIMIILSGTWPCVRTWGSASLHEASVLGRPVRTQAPSAELPFRAGILGLPVQDTGPVAHGSPATPAFRCVPHPGVHASAHCAWRLAHACALAACWCPLCACASWPRTSATSVLKVCPFQELLLFPAMPWFPAICSFVHVCLRNVASCIRVCATRCPTLRSGTPAALH